MIFVLELSHALGIKYFVIVNCSIKITIKSLYNYFSQRFKWRPSKTVFCSYVLSNQCFLLENRLSIISYKS